MNTHCGFMATFQINLGYSNNNSNTHTNFNVLSSCQIHCDSSASSRNECRFSTTWLPTPDYVYCLGLWAHL